MTPTLVHVTDASRVSGLGEESTTVLPTLVSPQTFL